MSLDHTRHTVVFVGAGPGDPELVTRKGWRLIGRADIVLYDALLDVEGFRQAAPLARWINVGKRLGRVSTAQSFITKSLVNLARRGCRVVRLKGGDPAIFGRLTEEIDACRAANIDVEIVPGVTAASASAAELGISLTQREVSRSVTFLTPRTSNSGALSEDWVPSALSSDTTILYMASAALPSVAQRLISDGKNPQTLVALVESASRDGKRVVMPLSQCLNGSWIHDGGPVTVVIGDVVRGAVGIRAPLNPLDSPLVKVGV
ncbi:MAG: uroporphyrinogen-III C-methyltransferase [Betaproteobacteria bacterium]|nr:uroporphyrinogen-III C-methyltransferase [Betaproteobacteria bacterium]NBT74899.1 uroporphyrinogen-III C-methyltransferase [Betaproteobacteria bacterium]